MPTSSALEWNISVRRHQTAELGARRSEQSLRSLRFRYRRCWGALVCRSYSNVASPLTVADYNLNCRVETPAATLWPGGQKRTLIGRASDFDALSHFGMNPVARMTTGRDGTARGLKLVIRDSSCVGWHLSNAGASVAWDSKRIPYCAPAVPMTDSSERCSRV